VKIFQSGFDENFQIKVRLIRIGFSSRVVIAIEIFRQAPVEIFRA
jgi:hypothetical protein